MEADGASNGAARAPRAGAHGGHRGPLAFFGRHYRGDYPLARSYWVNTLLVSLFAPLLGLLLLPWLGEHFPARYGSAGFLLVTAVGVLAWFWAVAGTWASANKHVQRGGRPGWAMAARVMIVLGVLRTVADLVQLAPALQEHLHVAAGAQLGASTQLELRADGRSLRLSGGLNDGSARQLEQALGEAPTVRTVVLSSEGGWMREGQLLAEVIRRRGLATYVEDQCASACTIAFLAGRDRAAAPAARIGFHASRSVGSTEARPSAGETAQLRNLYLAAGLPEAFVRQALDTPHGDMWYPPHELLLSAGVLTRRSAGGETAALSTAVRSREALAAEFRRVALFARLAERSPQDFEAVMDVAWGKMRERATDAEVTVAARARLAAVLPRFLPLARDETLVAYQALMQAQLEALRTRDVASCVEMAFPSGRALEVAGHLPPELVQQETALMARMLQEADPARGVSPDEQAVARVARRGLAALTPAQLTLFSDPAARQRAAPDEVCAAAIRFFAGLNAMPQAERGPALRVLYAGG